MSKMSLDQLGPTLFIGLGGAGGHVVARLNRLADNVFEDDYKRLGGACPLQFLLLDTDDFEKLDPEVRDSLGKRQQSFVSLSHFNPRRYAEKQLEIHDTDLKRWFDKDALAYLEDVTIHDGASRLRMLGRLCLHRHYETVEQRIREKVDAALDSGVHKESTRIRPEPPPLRIYIVASSCGGTGSAIFLDIALMVNRIVRDRGWSPDLAGFVFLPFPYIEANSKLDPSLKAYYEHNAWAFFEELNYFLANPERVPEYALDPERRFWDHARPLDEYGRDLMRTIYLVGNHIPTIGTLPLGGPLYEYTAQGIFHTFLTPEEGAIQSHYSNIKSKLKDRDRKFDLVKRFAAFGYAEYRPSSGVVSKGVEELVFSEWQELLGQRLDDDKLNRLTKELVGQFNARLDKFRRQARDWQPTLGIEGPGDRVSDLDVSQIHQLPETAQSQGRRVINTIIEQARTELKDAVSRLLEERLKAPVAGIEAERMVLERLREELVRSCGTMLASAQHPGITDDEKLRTEITELARTKPEPKRRLPFGKGKIDDAERSLFVNALNGIRHRIREVAKAWAASEVERGLAELFDNAVFRLLDEHSDKLRTLAGILKDHEPRLPAPADFNTVPTIQQVPPPRLLDGAALNGELKALRSSEGAKNELRKVWGEFLSRVSSPAFSAEDAAEWLKSRIREVWESRANKELRYESPLAAVEDWAKRLGARDSGAGASSEREAQALLANLYSLSAPACPVDVESFDKSDPVARIFAVVGPFKGDDDAKNQLSIPYPCSHIGGANGNRIAVLQTWYAFSSRAIEGVEALRRSYLRRDRKQSLPHIDKRWNAEGLFQSTGTGDLNSRDEELVARLLALAPYFHSTNGDLQLGSRFRLQRDERDDTPLSLLVYADQGYGYTFHWRDVRRRDGYDGTWMVLQPSSSARNGRAIDSGRETDLLTELRTYLMSEAREQHEEVLADLSEIENTEAGVPIIEAYRRYIDALDLAIADEERQGRIKHLDLLRRLMGRLDEYVRGLGHEAPVKL